MQGVKGDAVVIYREPLTTKQMRCHQLSQRIKNMVVFPPFFDIIHSAFHDGDGKGRTEKLLLLLEAFCHVFCATLG